MISKKKKIVILVGMIALLVVTGVLNVYLNTGANADIAETGTELYSSFFKTYSADRAATRTQTLMYLDAIIQNSASGADALAAAEAEKLDIIKNMSTESTLQVQVESLGFEDVVVTCSAQKITVIIKTEALDDVEVAQILNLALSETKRPATDVRIIPVS